MNTLLLFADGRVAERVAEVLFIDIETVREHCRLYQASGSTGGANVQPTASAIRVVLGNARYNHSKELKAWLACDDCWVELVDCGRMRRA